MSTVLRPLSLRELTREYTLGSIDRQTYRQRRSRLLNELAAYTPSHSTILRPPPSATAPRERITPPPERKQRSKSIIIVPLVILTLLLTAVLLYLYFILPSVTDAESPLSSLRESSSGPSGLDPIAHSRQASGPGLGSIVALH